MKMPRPKYRLWWLLVLVAVSALAAFALMPIRTGVFDIRQGEGPAVTSGDAVDVHFVGHMGETRLADWLNAGREFASTRNRNAPVSIGVGGGQIIPGFDSGLIGMKVGGVRKLVIPPGQAYGSKGSGGVIPPNATLIFEVELLKIGPKVVPFAKPPSTDSGRSEWP